MGFAELRRKAIEGWRTWAATLADGGKPPVIAELLEAAAVLAVREPMAALEADAAAVAEVRDLEQRAAICRDAIKQRAAPYGGAEGVRARIAELKRELEKLQGLIGITAVHHQAGTLAGEATRLRARHPRVFQPVSDKPAAKRRKREAVA